MTELQWLIKMLTKHKLSPSLKNLFIERIGEVEASLSNNRGPARPMPIPPIGQQAASTQKIIDAMVYPTDGTIPQVVAQTPATAAALEARQTAIKIATSGKPEAGRTSPRKF
jgi:hypothetical protein